MVTTIIFNLLLFYLLFIILYRVVLFLLRFSLRQNSMDSNRRKTDFGARNEPRREKEIIDADFEEIK